MLDYLVSHALQNVWCNPRQDRSAIVAIKRMTPFGGVRNHVEVMWRKEPLPVKGPYFHVYGLGQTAPGRLNLDTTGGEWINLMTLCSERQLTVDLYTETGLKVNPAWVWVKRTVQKFFVVAIQKQDTTPIKIDAAQLYMRFYSNSFWNSPRSATVNPQIVVQGTYIDGTTNINALQFQFLQHRALPVGKAYAFRNGRYINNFLPEDNQAGDHLHWVYDGSIKATYDFKLNELETFLSSLDNTRKYLLHPPKSIDLIDYHDDVDVYLIEKAPNGKETGVYVHRNDVRSVRMVTHRDYALSVDFIQTYIDDNSSWLGNPNVYVRLHVRHAGYDRPLIDEHLRIKELYKLTDAEIKRAMLGIDSTITEWRAAHLEMSNYTRIMRSLYESVTSAEVVDAYGYNAIAKLTADSPLRVVDQSVILPVGLREQSTIFEYDAQGLLLGWRLHYSGETYFTLYPNTALIEGVVGLGGLDASITLGNAPVTLDPNQSYRFYVSTIVAGVMTQEWVDVTGNQQYYQLQNGVVTWLLDPAGQIGAVKGNRHFICYALTLTDQDMAYRISVNHTPIQGNVLRIPPGRIDIFLNGRALQEHLDYKVQYPEIVITNKEYLRTESQPQNVVIRCTGFSDPVTGREGATERGFVVYQKLSVDSTYDLRDDKVKRVVVDGRTFHRSSLNFEESGHDVLLPNIADGRPYFIEDVIVPIRGVSAYNTYVLRQRSQSVDARVSDYLSTKLPPPTYPEQPQIPSLYWIYSPTTAKLIADLTAGFLTAPSPTAEEADVALAMQPYLLWLPYDPCLDDGLDLRFISIHPHPEQVVLSLSRDDYLFLERVVKIYLRNRVDLSSFVSIAD